MAFEVPDLFRTTTARSSPRSTSRRCACTTTSTTRPTSTTRTRRSRARNGRTGPSSRCSRTSTRCPRRSAPPSATTPAATRTIRSSGRSCARRRRRAVGSLADAIDATFGGVDELKDAGERRRREALRLAAGPGSSRTAPASRSYSTANQDSPAIGRDDVRSSGSTSGSTPTTSSTRTGGPTTSSAWWNVVNWDEVARGFEFSNRRGSEGRVPPPLIPPHLYRRPTAGRAACRYERRRSRSRPGRRSSRSARTTCRAGGAR